MGLLCEIVTFVSGQAEDEAYGVYELTARSKGQADCRALQLNGARNSEHT